MDIQNILSRNTEDICNIASYYKKNRIAYRLFNSHEGFVHMGISDDGSFSTNDFYKQARLVLEEINKLGAKMVLELAPGKAATLKYLAKEKPDVQFYGLDLPNGQLTTGYSRSNIELTYGDYHDLSHYSNSSMDIIYIVEALCHAHNKAKVIAEAFRVLKKDGRLIIIDGYFSKDISTLSEDQKTAVKLVARSMMVNDRNQEYRVLRNILETQGFKIIKTTDYSNNIMPSLYRLEHVANKYIKYPKLAKLITLFTGEIITANAAAGYLMPICVIDGLFEYRYTLAKK